MVAYKKNQINNTTTLILVCDFKKISSIILLHLEKDMTKILRTKTTTNITSLCKDQ